MYVGPSFLDSIARIVEARRPYYIYIYTHIHTIYIERERGGGDEIAFLYKDRAPITSPTAILSIDRFVGFLNRTKGPRATRTASKKLC